MFLGTIAIAGSNNIVHEMCEKAKSLLNTFFSNLHKRTVTPHDIDIIASAKSPFKTVKDFLLLQEFSNFASGTVDALCKEYSSYNSFRKRRIQLLHFSEVFHEFAEGK